jgi:Protein of unknown function (DUF1592)/Protein of unknown function (DUF1588)/Protein of unknown function (DUF1595)/Protein of unknown function (DUF1587)/Protein of unknown function (DUF1585)
MSTHFRTQFKWSRQVASLCLIALLTGCGGSSVVTSSSSSSSSSSTSSSSSSSSSSGGPVIASLPRIFGALEWPQVAAPLANPKLRHLSNTEYNNTIRDLLNIRGGFTQRFGFPDDALVIPFSNQGSLQEMSVDHIEALATANLALIRQALSKQTVPEWVCVENEFEDSCVNRIIETFGKRAWRRPLDPTEAMVIYASYTAARQLSLSFEESLSMALLRILMSPHFFYLPEIDSSFNELASSDLSAYELASRLSYFLWASTPDDELLSLADSGELLLDEVLQAQVARMLDDPKSASLVDDFARRWLGWDKGIPSRSLDRQLLASLETETRLFLNELIMANAPAEELLTATYSFMDARLKTHYGVLKEDQNLSAGSADSFARIDGNFQERQGILGHGAIILGMSNKAAHDPVQRGVWITEKLLCNGPPAPTFDHAAHVAAIRATTIPFNSHLTPRQEVEQLTAVSDCQFCHAQINLLGFGLENFDAMGKWQDSVLFHVASGTILKPIDATGQFIEGGSFADMTEMSSLLASSPRLPMCILSHLMTYATGREVQGFTAYGHQGPEYAHLYELYQQTAANGSRFQDLITAIVLNDGFHKRSSASGIGGNN